MRFRISAHAEWELQRRAIPLSLLEAVLANPEQRVPDPSHAARWIYQSRATFEDGKIYLLRVVVDEGELPPVVVTAYRTSKMDKYRSVE